MRYKRNDLEQEFAAATPPHFTTAFEDQTNLRQKQSSSVQQGTLSGQKQTESRQEQSASRNASISPTSDPLRLRVSLTQHSICF